MNSLETTVASSPLKNEIPWEDNPTVETFFYPVIATCAHRLFTTCVSSTLSLMQKDHYQCSRHSVL